MDDAAFRMHRFTLHFASAAAEAAYAEEQARKARRPFRVALASAFGFTLLLWATMHWIVPQISGARTYVAELMALALCVIALCYPLTYGRLFLRHQQTITLGAACLFALVSAYHASLMPQVMFAASGFVVFILYTLVCYSILRLRFPAATLAGWFTAAVYLVQFVGNDAPAGQLPYQAFFFVGANGFGMVAGYQMDLYARREFASMRALAEERARSERLLLNILPSPIAERLKASDEPIAEHSDGVTVLFADIVGFTELSARRTPRALVELLNRIFSEFDVLAEAHGLEKIKTIGDAYMAVAGLPSPWPDHALRAAGMALAMREVVARLAVETGEQLALRIGLHSGPVVAGVIGRRKFIYDMWGDTVNIASRMESHGMPGAIHCSEATAQLLGEAFQLQPRGAIEIKGKGEMRTFLITEAKWLKVGTSAVHCTEKGTDA